jgi:hypothetical protein
MKYKDILQFDPITEVIQLDRLDKDDYRKEVVKTFVYPDYFVETILPEMVENIVFSGRDKKGIQVIGNYGTGKSHLMSLVSLIAENEEYLNDVQNEKVKDIFEPIAGKFKVHRFEMQTDKKFWSVITFQLQRFLDAIGVEYRFDDASLKMYSEQLDEMMAAFEEKYPDHGFMLVIDEMLSYLKTHAAVGQLDHDLQVLQALGQQCAKGRFAFMFGVQEMIYQSKEFAFAAEMLLKVKDRYTDLTIRKEDVSFVVQKRLLRKSESQKKQIREHLEKFIPFFSEMHAHLSEYVELFPVHPSYFENFQKIRLGRAQREVLKTLSAQFAKISEEEIPADNPGLITYDQYWEQMMADAGLMSIPDFKTVADTVKIVHDKIESNFEGVRAKQIPLAKRITNATAIKILQGELSKRNGARAETLVEDLCVTNPLAENKEFLVDAVNSCAKHIVGATSGQYFEFNEENYEYRLRTEGGVNIDQQIIQFAETMSANHKDEAFFRFMVEVLGIEDSPYRTGFRIYKHEIEWKSHRITRDGYIFLGNPNEKSTTHPKQYFYMIVMPIFQEEKKKRNNDSDEVYFVFDTISDEFKNLVCNYGAAFSLWNSADTSLKPIYKGKMEDLFQKTRREFDTCYLSETKVYYKNEPVRELKSFQLPQAGASRLEIFDSVASAIFDEQFKEQTPHHPVFSLARQTINSGNLDRYIKGTIAKIINPTESNQDGEAVLTGLGCYKAGELEVDESIYAISILNMMNERESQMVVNQNEILELLPNSDQVWRSKDYGIDAAFEFMVLSVLVALGECEIKLNSGEILNAANLDKLRNLQADDYFNFAFIKRPKGVNLPVIKAITKSFCGKDLSNRLDQQDTYVSLVNSAKKLAAECATTVAQKFQTSTNIAGVDIVSADEALRLRNNTTALKGFCDRLSTFTSEAKLKNLPFDLETVNKMIGYKNDFESLLNKLNLANELEAKVSYLTQAKQYIPAETELSRNIDATIQSLPKVLTAQSESEVENYKTELETSKQHYINWYLRKYREYCINDIDDAKRVEIFNSAEYVVCEELAKCPLLNATTWQNWRMKFNKLRKADSNVENILATTPYANFNPLTVGVQEMKNVRELGVELEDIYQMWIRSLKDFIKTSDAQDALKLMDEGGQNFLNRFVNGMEPIQDGHSAQVLLELINILSEGFEKVEINQDGMSKYFTHPMTITEAKGAFELYIEQMSKGKDRNKVRIILHG